MSAIIHLLTFLSLLAWFVFYWQAGLTVWNDIRSALAKKQTRLDALLLIAATRLSAGILTTCAWMLIRKQTGILPVAAQMVGVLVTVFGIYGTFYCRRFLGRFWTAETSLQNNHQIISSGSYGWVRHPIYACTVLAYFGAGLVFSSWWNNLALVATITLVYILKTRDEDIFFKQNLPGYADYAGQVRYRLLTGVW